MKVLRRLVDELGKSVMVVIHDINFVSCYADYIIAMKDGKLICQGDTDEIIEPSILKEIYGIDIQVETINGKRICLYYE